MTKESIRREFIDCLEREATIFDGYDDSNENTIRIRYVGENSDEIEIFVSFSVLDDGAILASIGCYDFPNFSDNLRAAYAACNQLNDDNIPKFNIDEDGDAILRDTVLFNSHGFSTPFIPEMVLSAAILLATTADDAIPVFNDLL